MVNFCICYYYYGQMNIESYDGGVIARVSPPAPLCILPRTITKAGPWGWSYYPSRRPNGPSRHPSRGNEQSPLYINRQLDVPKMPSWVSYPEINLFSCLSPSASHFKSQRTAIRLWFRVSVPLLVTLDLTSSHLHHGRRQPGNRAANPLKQSAAASNTPQLEGCPTKNLQLLK